MSCDFLKSPMTAETRKRRKSNVKTEEQDKRLAEALRQNLLRRKQAARGDPREGADGGKARPEKP